jgi:hypothetical protein
MAATEAKQYAAVLITSERIKQEVFPEVALEGLAAGD